MKIKTGKGSVTLVVLLAIWSVSAIASLPGLAVSPILGDLNKVFPKVTDLEIQMLTSLPSLLIIPFVLLSGKLSEGRDKLKILIVGLSIFFLSGVACLFARSMGAVNVQVIMESLGGGGHQTMAAAQLKHITPQAARSRIQDAIDQYYLSQKKTTPEARPAKGE